LMQAVDKLRGEPGEKVTLTVQRPATKEIKDYELTRVTIKVKSVKDAQILPTADPDDLKVGYVRVTQFNEPTAAELAKALDKLEKDGMQALVLDLRYNPGGLLSSAVDVCGSFPPQSTKVVPPKAACRAGNIGQRPGAKRAPIPWPSLSTTPAPVGRKSSPVPSRI
jgi:Periplasmic protease